MGTTSKERRKHPEGISESQTEGWEVGGGGRR